LIEKRALGGGQHQVHGKSSPGDTLHQIRDDSFGTAGSE
jgi:hypothetical protein